MTAKSDRSWSLTEALGAFTLPRSTDCLRQKKISGHEGCLSGADLWSIWPSVPSPTATRGHWEPVSTSCCCHPSFTNVGSGVPEDTPLPGFLSICGSVHEFVQCLLNLVAPSTSLEDWLENKVIPI